MLQDVKCQKRAVILGGTSPHIELIQKLKIRGYYTILMDYLENPLAKNMADKHVRESTLDLEKVYEVAKENNADLVISACIDQANATACYVAEKLGLPAPYSYDTAKKVTNKKLMKQIFKENLIPTADFYTLDHISQIKNAGLPFPVVVKPADCNSSKGVRRADTGKELEKYVEMALHLSRTHCAIIETFCEGTEIQVDCIAQANTVNILMTRQKKKITDEKGLVLQSVGSWIPAALSKELKSKIELVALRIASAFQLTNTPFFFQAIVQEDNIFVLEFAPRIGGGLSTYLIKAVTGIDILDVAIESYLNREIVIDKVKEKNCATTLLYVNPGKFGGITGLDKMKEQGIIMEYFIYKSGGTVIDSDVSSNNRVGSFVVEGKTTEEIAKKEKAVMQNIRVVDTEGKEILKKELYGLYKAD